MRICLLSKTGTSSNWLYEGTHDALKGLGIQILDINVNRERNEDTPHWVSVPTLTPAARQKPEDTDIIEKIRAFRPDYLFILSYSSLPFFSANAKELKDSLNSGGKIMYWTGDLARQVHENKYLGGMIDYIFLNDVETIGSFKKEWGNPNVFYMPHGTIPARMFPASKRFRHNVAFLGRRQKADNRYVERNAVLDAFAHGFRMKEENSVVSPNDVHAFYRSCKIALAVSWDNHAKLYTSDRIWNIMGAGTFCLHYHFTGIERLVENGNHLIWFTAIDEGLELARFYMKHDDLRERIGLAGYNLVKYRHTYRNRVENILSIMEGSANGFNGFI